MEKNKTNAKRFDPNIETKSQLKTFSNNRSDWNFFCYCGKKKLIGAFLVGAHRPVYRAIAIYSKLCLDWLNVKLSIGLMPFIPEGVCRYNGISSLRALIHAAGCQCFIILVLNQPYFNVFNESIGHVTFKERWRFATFVGLFAEGSVGELVSFFCLFEIL